MKKLLLVSFISIVLLSSSKPNPIPIDPVISEFYYNGGEWQIELYFDYFYGHLNNFSEIRICSRSDTAYFYPGPITIMDVIVIDESSFTSAFNIDPNDDYIYFQEEGSAGAWYTLGPGISYSLPPDYSSTSPPLPGESIAFQKFSEDGTNYPFYRLMKQSPPSIGVDPFSVFSRANFSGYVFDQYHNPLPGIYFKYCSDEFCQGITLPQFECFETNENGYFEVNGLFTFMHGFMLHDPGFNYIFYDDIFFEPDSSYYKEYILSPVDVTYNKMDCEVSISVAPNPFSQKTTFHISLSDYQRWGSGEITIRNMNGQIVDIISFPNAEWSGNKFTIDWYPMMAHKDVMPGIYLYSLLIDGKYIDSGKLIMQN